jgi:hypothetical protein
MRRFVRENSLSLFFGLIFLAALTGQAFAGHADYNAQQVADGLATVSLGRYLTSSSFAVDVAENWQSEYLQFLLYILATVWLLQRGSPESKSLDQAGTESAAEQKVGPYADDASPALARRGGLATRLYSTSLGLAMGTIFVASWAIQSLAGRVAYDEQQLAQLQAPLSWPEYVVSADGGAVHLPAPARFTRIQAGRLRAQLHRGRGLSPPVQEGRFPPFRADWPPPAPAGSADSSSPAAVPIRWRTGSPNQAQWTAS